MANTPQCFVIDQLDCFGILINRIFIPKHGHLEPIYPNFFISLLDFGESLDGNSFIFFDLELITHNISNFISLNVAVEIAIEGIV